MHGDRMKKNIKVNYKSIFKYDDHHETVQFKSDGIYEKGFDKEKFTFYNNDQKIEIHYHTDYGMIELFTELITMEHDRYLKVKYILSDGYQQLSEVYVMMKYDFYGEENEAI